MDQFEVELDALDRIGNKRLPDIAASIENAAGELRNATDWITRTFDTHGEPHTEQPYLFYLFWRPGNDCHHAMDAMRRVFADNRDTITLAAHAIGEIAQRYRRADGQG